MNSSLACCDARIECALEYLAHETDLIRAIVLAETQLKSARSCLAIARGHHPERRVDDSAPRLTFVLAEKVPPSPWPPLETADTDKSFREVFGERAA